MVGLADLVWFDVTPAMIHRGKIGVLRNGDGRAGTPYRVQSVEQEYEVLRYISEGQCNLTEQRFLPSPTGRSRDVLAFEDGSAVYFDVSRFFDYSWRSSLPTYRLLSILVTGDSHIVRRVLKAISP